MKPGPRVAGADLAGRGAVRTADATAQMQPPDPLPEGHGG